MRNLSLSILIFSLLSSFDLAENINPVPVTYEDLSCYRMRSRSVSHADYNIWVITNKAALEENFIADSCASDLHFENKLVVALKLETNTGTYKTTINRITNTSNTIHVYFSTKRLKIPVETGSPLEMVELSRDSNLKQIKFYHDDQLVRTVPVVSVY